MEKNIEEYLRKRSHDVAEEWEFSVSNSMEKQCDSPIEKLFLIEWYFQTRSQIEPEKEFFIYPQYKIENQYFVDFLIFYATENEWLREHKTLEEHKDKILIVEIDSHIWHGQTPEQFEKEKKRERYLITEEYRVMRFSGREIYRDVKECVNQVIDYFIKKRRREIDKEMGIDYE